MRSRPSLSRCEPVTAMTSHAVGLVVIALALSSCGADGAPRAPAAPQPLDRERIARLGGSGPTAAPRTAALQFWREVQFSNFARAYGMLEPAGRTRLPYRRFVGAMVAAAPIFRAQPTATAASLRDDRAAVTIRFAVGASPRQPQAPVVLRLILTDGRWRLPAVPPSATQPTP